MSHKEQKMIREAGTPALLCFKPEEQPTGCRITSLINMNIRVKAKPSFLCLKPGFDLALGKVLLTGVGTAPSSMLCIILPLFKSFAQNPFQKIMIVVEK